MAGVASRGIFDAMQRADMAFDPLAAAYAVYFLILIVAFVLIHFHVAGWPQALVLGVLVLHFLGGGYVFYRDRATASIKDRYCKGRAGVVALLADTMLATAVVVAAIWTTDAIAYTATALAFAGNIACLGAHFL